MNNKNLGEIIIYESTDGKTKVDVKIEDETVWLTLDQMSTLFDRDKSTISRHIKNIFEVGELDASSTVAKNATVQMEGTRQVERDVLFYNLDMIISVGYRVNSIRGTQFRKWATERLKEYIIKGFTMDDERLKGNGDGNYWKELLNRIRDIRSSEKVVYRQVLDLYATSEDYNPKAEETIKFFKIVQNKLHYVAHGHTASEVIFDRADAEKEFMGLTTFKGEMPTLEDVKVAKNYLTEKELKILNNLVSGYFDFAEVQAMKHNHMYMKDYIESLDRILSSTGEKLLEGSEKVSHDKVIEKATSEYKKYQQKTLSPVEKEYLDTIRKVEKQIKDK